MIFMGQDELAFIAQVARALAKQPDPGLGLPELLEQINQYLGSEAISIFVLDEAKDELVLKYAAGPVAQHVLGLRLPLELGVVGWVVKFNDALIVPAPNLDARFFSGVDQQTNFVTHSIVCVPIAKGKRKLGALEVLNKLSGPFTDDDVVLLQELARTVVDTYASL